MQSQNPKLPIDWTIPVVVAKGFEKPLPRLYRYRNFVRNRDLGEGSTVHRCEVPQNAHPFFKLLQQSIIQVWRQS